MKNKNKTWAYSFCIAGALLILGNSCKEDEPLLAVVSTVIVTDIAQTTAISGGNVASDGGSTITARGVCWSLDTTPTIEDSKTSDGTGTGSFTSNITGLTPNVTYNVRAYVTNGAGTSYGSYISMTMYGLEDIDGNRYHSVKIGTQEWMQENLKTTKYSDGSEIPNVTDDTDWVNLSSGAYCDYNNNANTVTVYGRLYNWYAVIDQRNVCPTDWHIPTIDEWGILIDELGGDEVAGGEMKSTGILQTGDGLWNSPNTGATNSSGFTGIPAGTRFDVGDFRDINSFGHWSSLDGLTIRLRNSHGMVEKFNFFANNGTSVRCIKD